jgi:hypothetical protein
MALASESQLEYLSLYHVKTRECPRERIIRFDSKVPGLSVSLDASTTIGIYMKENGACPSFANLADFVPLVSILIETNCDEQGSLRKGTRTIE